MPAKKQPAFRRATRGNSIAPSLPTPEETQSTSLIQKNLELVSQELLQDYLDLERRCALSFLQIETWLSQEQATADILQGTLDTLGLASDCTMNKAGVTQSGEDSTQSQLSAPAQSQSVTRADMAKTIEMIQSKMHELHESARSAVSARLKLEFPKIVRAVIQNLKENGDLENALQKFENEICENMRLTCLKIEKTSEEYTHINTKKYHEHCTKNLEAQMVKIRTTVTENHQLEKKWHDELAQEIKLRLESHCDSEFRTLKSRCNENYLKLQAQVDKVQKKVNQHQVNVESTTENNIKQFEEEVRLSCLSQYQQAVDRLGQNLKSIQQDLLSTAEMVEKNESEVQKARIQLQKIQNSISSSDTKNQHELSEVQMETLRNYIRSEVNAIGKLHQWPSAGGQNSEGSNLASNVDQTAIVVEKLSNILATSNNLAQSLEIAVILDENCPGFVIYGTIKWILKNSWITCMELALISSRYMQDELQDFPGACMTQPRSFFDVGQRMQFPMDDQQVQFMMLILQLELAQRVIESISR